MQYSNSTSPDASTQEISTNLVDENSSKSGSDKLSLSEPSPNILMKTHLVANLDIEGDEVPLDLQIAGHLADHEASVGIFADYQARRADQTLRQQARNLMLFRDWLTETAADPGDLYTDAKAWQGITWGLVARFVQWNVDQGYAIATTNNRLSTIKKYAALALQAGTLTAGQYAMIKAISGYSQREGRNLDRKRQINEVPTRRGHKAAEPILLNAEQITLLKEQPNTPQGRRDALLMCILLDHGLRCSELAFLKTSDMHLSDGEMRFYRPKVDMTQIHQLSTDTLAAAKTYLSLDAQSDGPLLLASRQGGTLKDVPMSERSITKRVKTLGLRTGIQGLSAHDCRHTWATMAARAGTPLERLQQAGGWTSPSMPIRYIEAARVANQGVLLK